MTEKEEKIKYTKISIHLLSLRLFDWFQLDIRPRSAAIASRVSYYGKGFLIIGNRIGWVSNR